MRYAIACASHHFWNVLAEHAQRLAADCSLQIRAPEQLSAELLRQHQIDVVFFPHWSWRVPDAVLEAASCVCFHAAPLPYGRGGSPIQNMVLAGHDTTELVALKMSGELDAGPVYLRRPVSLLGGGEEVMLRLYRLVVEMMQQLAPGLPVPLEQAGEAHIFKRRTPADSVLPAEAELQTWFDQIRILDIADYPPAYLDYGEFRLEFTRPALRFGEAIEATVTIKRIKRSEHD